MGNPLALRDDTRERERDLAQESSILSSAQPGDLGEGTREREAGGGDDDGLGGGKKKGPPIILICSVLIFLFIDVCARV